MSDIEIEIDFDKELGIEIDFPNVTLGGSIGSFILRNSDNSFNQVISSSPYTVPDDTFNFTINGVTQTVMAPALVGHTFNLSP